MRTSASHPTAGKRRQAYNSSSKHSNGHSDYNESNESDGLFELFLNELKDMYWAEKALVKALPKMAAKATSDELQEAIENHLSETEQQVERLEEVFELIGEEAKTKKCYAMQGLITEAQEIMEEAEEGMVRDAAIISAAQKVEHYEIASYGTLKTFATVLGEDEVADLLEETLNEEKNADETLTEIAESSVNTQALHQ